MSDSDSVRKGNIATSSSVQLATAGVALAGPGPSSKGATAADITAAKSLYQDRFSLGAMQAGAALETVSKSKSAWRTPSPDDEDENNQPKSFFGLAQASTEAPALFQMAAHDSEPEPRVAPEPQPESKPLVCGACIDDVPPPYSTGQTGLVYDDRMLGHRDPLETADEPHPEQPARISAIHAELQKRGLARRCKKIEATPARRVDLERVHDTAHVGQMLGLQTHTNRLLQKLAERYDSVYLNNKSLSCALLAAGGTVNLTLSVCRGEIDNGLAVVRPPGHHAECGCAMGFCLFNNIAVAAQTALDTSKDEHLGVNRVLIVDWDVHHVNQSRPRRTFAQCAVIVISTWPICNIIRHKR